MWKRSILIVTMQCLAFGAIIIMGFVAYPNIALSKSLTVTINLTDAEGVGKPIGNITLEDKEYGLLLTPDLAKLKPGIHGLHIHQNPDCSAATKNDKVVPGLAAGGHYDPAKTAIHQGPYGEGHLGDLPPLLITEDGTVTTPVLAPRLKQADVMGHSIVVHLMGDNFSDRPEPLGGGGARFACGVI